MIFWLISKLPLRVVKILPWLIGMLGLVYIVSFFLALDDLTDDLVRYWLS